MEVACCVLLCVIHAKQDEAQLTHQTILFRLCHKFITFSKGHSKTKLICVKDQREKHSAIIERSAFCLKWSHLPQSAYLWCLCTAPVCSLMPVWRITALCNSLYHAPVTCCGELCAHTCPMSPVKCATANVRILSKQ